MGIIRKKIKNIHRLHPNYALYYLRECAKILRSQCHIRFCKKSENCPKYHFFCCTFLNYKTAILWEMASCIEFFCSWYRLLTNINLETYPTRKQEFELLKANNAKENFKILLQALYLHESSKELNELGCGVISAMDNALNNIDNYKRKKEERKKKSI